MSASVTGTGLLIDKVAIVTGGGRGMGRAIANAFAAEGADVAIIDRMQDHLEAVIADIEGHGRRGFAVHADLTDVGRLPQVFADIIAELGGLDILMNNAGVQAEIVSALDTTEEIWDHQIDVNAKALYFCAQTAARYFVENEKPGKIINTCSTASITAEPGFAAYCASKGAVLQITRGMASEFAQYGINVNGVGPTLVETEMTKAELEDTEYKDAYINRLPARAIPEPEHIADAAVFLASDKSKFVHGHMLLVDSGETVI